jgi:hypothetical protein
MVHWWVLEFWGTHWEQNTKQKYSMPHAKPSPKEKPLTIVFFILF